MNEELTRLIKESINLELNVSKLYLLFYDLYPEDMDFWWKMANEEKNHAALLKSLFLYMKLEIFPEDILYKNINELGEINQLVINKIKDFTNNKPPKEIAYNFALNIENSAAEFHLQNVLQKSTNNKILKIMKKLNGEDKDHAQRIKNIMDKHSIIIR